jgi:2-isopropylmalate synthase
LKKSRDQVLEDARQAVRYAKSLCEDVEFSAEDAARSDMGYLCRVFEAVIEEGATVLNVPDTVGYAIPSEFAARIRYLRSHVPNIGKAVLSIHCHNDLGLAVANSLAAVQEGARQVECTINGIGERAGNASLEEIVMALYTRRDLFGPTR